MQVYPLNSIEDKHFHTLPREENRDEGLRTVMILLLQPLQRRVHDLFMKCLSGRYLDTKINTFFAKQAK